MHPPLDRPHPECQLEIIDYRDCHATASKLKFWACNDAKAKLDRCFREEKKKMLEQLNRDLDERKREEQSMAAQAFNKKQTFQEYLSTDPKYQKDLERERKKQNSWYSKMF